MLAHLSIRFVSRAIFSGANAVVGSSDTVDARCVSDDISRRCSAAEEAADGGRGGGGGGGNLADCRREDDKLGKIENGADDKVARRLCWQARAAGCELEKKP